MTQTPPSGAPEAVTVPVIVPPDASWSLTPVTGGPPVTVTAVAVDWLDAFWYHWEA